MQAMIRGLTWPVAALIGVGATHLAAELLRPELQAAITPPVVMPIYLAFGAWAGAATVREGGSLAHGVAAGLAIGLLPVALQVVGFGIIAGRDGATVATNAMVGFLGLVWGSVLGAGLSHALALPAVATARR